MAAIYRAIRPQDFDAVLALNRNSGPGVSAISVDEIALLTRLCEFARVVELEGKIVGYIFALRGEQDYDGVEYQWFSEHLDGAFLYIDQIAIAGGCKGQGHGKALYRALENHAVRQRIDRLACEVNYEPANLASLAFHEKSGFKEVTRMTARGFIVSLFVKSGLRQRA